MFAGFSLRAFSSLIFYPIFILTISFLAACSGGSGGTVPADSTSTDSFDAGSDGANMAVDDQLPSDYYVVTQDDAVFVQQDEAGNYFVGPKPTGTTQRRWSQGLVMSDPQRDAGHGSVAISDAGRVVVTWIETQQGASTAALNAAIYGMPDDVPTEPLPRTAIPTTRLNAGEASLITREVGAVARESIEIQPASAQLAMNSAGDSFVVWLEAISADNAQAQRQLKVAYLPATTEVPDDTESEASQGWVMAPPIPSETGMIEDFQISPLPVSAGSDEGRLLLLWRETRPSGASAWVARSVVPARGSLGTAVTLTENAQPQGRAGLWRVGEMPFIALQLKDAVNSLATARLDLASGSVDWFAPTGGAGEKFGIQGAFVDGRHVLAWLETDEYGYRSVYAAISKRSTSAEPSTEAIQWSAPRALEVAPGNVSQLRLVSSVDRAQLFWSNIDETVYGVLYTAAYTSDAFEAPKRLYDTGADTPSVSYGPDGSLYLMWRAMHTFYKEHHPSRGWRKAKRIFCVEPLFGMCYEGGREQRIRVQGVRGVTLWRERRDRNAVVAMSLSWKAL